MSFYLREIHLDGGETVFELVSSGDGSWLGKVGTINNRQLANRIVDLLNADKAKEERL